MANKKLNSLSPWSSVLSVIAVVLFVLQFILADKYIVTQPEYYSAPHLLFTLSRFWFILLAAVLAIVGALIKSRRLSLVFLTLSVTAALVQFFAIKITDVFPYFITYDFATIWPLYLGGALIIGGCAMKFFNVED